MENYQSLSIDESMNITGSGKYDKQGYQLGVNIGKLVKGAITIWRLIKYIHNVMCSLSNK